MGRFEIRLVGAGVAAAIAVIVAVLFPVVWPLFWPGFNGGFDMEFAVLAVAAAGISAMVMVTRVRAGWLHGIAEMFGMAAVTYVIAILLFPIIHALGAWPQVSQGGEVPCFFIIHDTCRSGLSGPDAQGALIDATLSWYPAAPVAFLFGLPILAALVVPSAVWVVAMRRIMDRFEKPYEPYEPFRPYDQLPVGRPARR